MTPMGVSVGATAYHRVADVLFCFICGDALGQPAARVSSFTPTEGFQGGLCCPACALPWLAAGGEA